MKWIALIPFPEKRIRYCTHIHKGGIAYFISYFNYLVIQRSPILSL